jgi:hypothetical protein
MSVLANEATVRSSPLRAGDVEVDTQRPPDVAGLDAVLDGLGRGPAVEAGQHVIDQHRCAVGSTEPQNDPLVELRQPHASQDTQADYPVSASASWHTRTGSATLLMLAAAARAASR